MVADHTRLNDELGNAAKKDGFQVPTDLSAKQRAEIQALSKLFSVKALSSTASGCLKRVSMGEFNSQERFTNHKTNGQTRISRML